MFRSKLILVLVGALLLAAGCDTPTQTPAFEAAIPAYSGYVTDTTNTIKPETEASLESSLKSFDQTAQIAVLLTGTTGVIGIEEFGIKLAEKWKPGYEGKDNGVILIIAKDDRKTRIEVGRGLEEKLTDAKSGRILDQCVLPSLKKGDYDGAIVSGVECIKAEINK